jgi:hypothetical protein
MSRVRRFGERIAHGLLAPVPAHGMVLLRVGLGATLFFAYLSRWPLVEVLYGPEGYAGASYHARYPESGPIGWPLVQAFDQLQYVSSGALIWALYLALLACAACFALGIRSRLTGFALFVLHVLFVGRNPASYWGWATMIKPFLLYAIFAARPHHASIVQWWRRRRSAAPVATDWTCPAWPLRLVQVHASCVFLVLWERIDRESWTSGQMLFAALQSRDWGRIDFDWHPYLDLLEVAGLAALGLELGAAGRSRP